MKTNEEIKKDLDMINLKRIKSLIDYEDGIEVLKDFILQKENINYVPTDKGKDLFLNVHNSLKQFISYINNLSDELSNKNRKKEMKRFLNELRTTIIEMKEDK